MRKLVTILVIIVTLFMLVGCSIKENPRAKIVNQFDEYLDNDIIDEDDFDKFINDVSNYNVPGFVVVRATLRNAFNQIIEIREGTGFVFAIYDESLRVLTSLDIVRTQDESQKLTVEILDYANRLYSALVLTRSEEYNLATIKFDTYAAVAKLRKMDISPYVPMDNEPILMISNYKQSRNSLNMGWIIEKNSETGFYKTSLPADEYIIGGTVINLNKEIVGIVVSVESGVANVLGVEHLRAFLNI